MNFQFKSKNYNCKTKRKREKTKRIPKRPHLFNFLSLAVSLSLLSLSPCLSLILSVSYCASDRAHTWPCTVWLDWLTNTPSRPWVNSCMHVLKDTHTRNTYRTCTWTLFLQQLATGEEENQSIAYSIESWIRVCTSCERRNGIYRWLSWHQSPSQSHKV